MLRQRFVSSSILILILWLVIFILPPWVFLWLVVTVIGLGLYEFFQMVSNKGILIYRYFGTVIGCLIPITMYLRLNPSAEVEFMLITAVCLVVFLLQFTRRKTDQAVIGIATTVFGIFYISWFLSFIVKLRFWPPQDLDGKALVLYLLLVTKMGDISAYFVGTFWGRHQLIPRISPKKSLEGPIAGLLTSFVIAFLLRNLLPTFSTAHIIGLGVLIGAVSQIGDLSESLLKRDCQVKDSGSFFPGLGGMLDLIDSLLFTTPIFYFYLRFMS